MSSKRRGIVKESQVELSVREWVSESVSEFVNLWSKDNLYKEDALDYKDDQKNEDNLI